MIHAHYFASTAAGPKLAITGGIHGNEVCGIKALTRLVGELDSGQVTLRQGSLVLVPVANPEAYVRNVRFVDENLNRVFTPTENPATYERKLANVLAPIVGECDALLDLHSIHSKGEPFGMYFGHFSDAEDAFINALGMPLIVEGWAEAYAASLPGINRGQETHTAAFMRSRGKIAAGVECGLHDDPAAVDVAYAAIIRALAHFGLIDNVQPSAPAARRIMMEKVVLRPETGDRLAQDFVHGDAVKKGDVIAHLKDGGHIVAEKDTLVLFPRPACPVGEEWFYTGRDI